jgi:hypothetical protein
MSDIADELGPAGHLVIAFAGRESEFSDEMAGELRALDRQRPSGPARRPGRLSSRVQVVQLTGSGRRDEVSIKQGQASWEAGR